MMLMGSTSGIPSQCVSEELRPFCREGTLRFRAEGPPLTVYIIAPLILATAVIAIVLLVCGFISPDWHYFAGFAAIGALAAYELHSIAFSAWGQLEVRWEDGNWIITRKLWSRSRTCTIRASQIRHVGRYDTSPWDLLFPGEEGPLLRVHFYRTERTVLIGEGLWLAPEVLQGLRDLLATRDGI
jgi:hypothetical protein